MIVLPPESDPRLRLLGPAMALRDSVGLTDADPWVYAVLGQRPDAAYVAGHLIMSLVPLGRPGESLGHSFRTPFAWDQRYAGHAFELIGSRAPAAPSSAGNAAAPLWPMTIDPGLGMDGPEQITMMLRCARVMKQGVPVFGQADWRPGWTDVEYSYVGVTPGRKNDTRAADEGLQLLLDIPKRKPGPAPGTVKAAKYKSPQQWHTAIREKVLTKRTIATAPDHQIANDWLEVSKATMYRLMAAWGPSTLEDLRNGKF